MMSAKLLKQKKSSRGKPKLRPTQLATLAKLFNK